MITALHLTGDSFDDIIIIKTGKYLNNLSQINTIVGQNNSGKSRFIRCLFEDFESIGIYDTNCDTKYLNQLINQYRSNYIQVKTQANQNLIHLKEEFDFTDQLSNSSKVNISDLLNIISRISTISKNSFRAELARKDIVEKTLSQFKQIEKSLMPQIVRLKSNNKFNTLYIPVLRGLRPIQRTATDHTFSNTDSYLLRTKFDYFSKSKSNQNIYTGLSIYEDVMKLLLGTEEDRLRIRGFELFLSEYIFNDTITLIPKYKEDVLHIKIGENKQLEIYNLGDGIQSIISILFPIYLAKAENYFIFIEEPEAHLHPKWQTQLIRALSTFKNHTFFLSTHSASIINSENTTSYSISINNGISEIRYTALEKNKLEVLLELGYKPSDILQSNYVLWVEGPSDKIYVQYWINRMAPHLKEGLHYSIMFFGGENYKHFLKEEEIFSLAIVNKLNPNLGIILDSDRKSKYEKYNKNKKEVETLFKKNNLFCWLTRYREIENYIPYDVFKRAVESFHQKKNIHINTGNFDDRCTIIDNDAESTFKSSIKLSAKIFKIVQKNANGTLDGIQNSTLRAEIEKSIFKTKSKTFRVQKIKIAQNVVKLNPELEDQELVKNIKMLIHKIEDASNISASS